MSAIFYRECKQPPKFHTALPGSIGYLTIDRRTVLYGHRPPSPDLPTPSRGWPDGDDFLARRARTALKIALGPKPKKRPKYRVGICVICILETGVTMHHLVPRQINAGSRATVDLCPECHTTVHRLFTNRQLANTHWPDVVDAVKNCG